MTNRIMISAQNHPISLVTVFSDRAEVTRSISGLILAAGQTEIVVDDLPANLDSDSIRVEAKSDVIIQDVMQKCQYVPKFDETMLQNFQPRRAQIALEIKALRSSRNRFRLDLKRVKESKKLLKLYAKKFTTDFSQNKKESPSMDCTKLTKTFRQFKEAQTTKLKANYKEQRLLKESIREIDSYIAILDNELEEIGGASNQTIVERKGLTIVVFSSIETLFEFDLSYVVSGASWTPKYDLRVDSESGRLFVFYQAEIKQNTSENWESVRLILSTAQPALGGDHPVLDIWKLHFEVPPKPRRKSSPKPSGAPRVQLATKAARSSNRDRSRFREERTVSSLSERIVESAVAVEKSAGMAFEIISQSSIPCDNAPHKVNVSFVELRPKFKVVSYPSKSPHSFLKAVIKNESEYAFLAGDANIFLDNSFIAKSSLKNVSPQEEFETSLGVDPAVRITYHPRVRKQQTQGIFTKSNVIHFEQSITIHNTRSQQVIVQIFDQLPLSEDEKVKVIMLEPIGIAHTVANSQAPAAVESIRKGREPERIGNMRITGVNYPRLDDKMVLEWMLVLDAGKQVVVKHVFEIIFPMETCIAGI